MRPIRSRALMGVGMCALALIAAACFPLPPPPMLVGAIPDTPIPPPPPPGSPDLSAGGVVSQSFVTMTNDGTDHPIDHPWDIAFGFNGTTTKGYFTERGTGGASGSARISSFDPVTAGTATVVGTVPGVYAVGESGLLGLALDPNFSSNHYLYVCVSASGLNPTNEVRRYTVNDALAPNGLTAGVVVLTGMRVNNFHDGCRIRFQPGSNPQALFISMGDAGFGPAPQDGTQYGGKILRAQVDNSNPLMPKLVAYPGNMWTGSPGAAPLVYSYGHRNPQGLAFNPNLADPQNNGGNWPYDAEHGPNINDEVNKLLPGGNAGWNPTNGADYDQSKPMTDFSLGSNVYGPVWRSGDSFTLAPSGITFLTNTGSNNWAAWNGALVVAFLKDSKLRLMFMDGNGAVTKVSPFPNLPTKRMRSVVEAPDGSLFVSTDATAPNDAIMRISPRL